jgi:NADPH-dependent curcumin reductase CurA
MFPMLDRHTIGHFRRRAIARVFFLDDRRFVNMETLFHSTPKLNEELAAACAKGIDVYYENVGGVVFDSVLPLLNARARIPLCGLIANYNGDPAAEGKYRTSQVMSKSLR